MKYILCRGCPGSGKTIWAEKLVSTSKNLVRINRDDLRRKYFRSKEYPGYVEGNATESGVTKLFNERLLDAASMKQDVVDDNTNMNQRRFPATVRAAQELGFDVEVKEFFDIPLDKLIERNLKREHSVPEDVIHKMFKSQMEIQNRIIVPDYSKQSCVVCDIDGTIADMGKGEPWGRGAFEWHKVLNDRTKENVINTVLDLSTRHHIFFLSGRDGIAYADTFTWIVNNVVSRGQFSCGWSLQLRKEGDSRPDSIGK